jgi:hypothetical protein
MPLCASPPVVSAARLESSGPLPRCAPVECEEPPSGPAPGCDPPSDGTPVRRKGDDGQGP